MKAVGRKTKQRGKDYPDAGASCRPGTLPKHGVSDPEGHEPGFAPRLLAWQLQHGRHDLPWQNTREPYRIWLSEIMLQQTQVTTVIPYYARFLKTFPDVVTLGQASSETVMAHWAGLGYYARARNLHACAKIVAERYGGTFPETAESLAELPGIGRSTAAAIAVFAFAQRAAILDGNVKRVLCRVFAIDGFPGQAGTERKLWALAERLLPAVGIEPYTQGLMDLGATLCMPKRPECSRCPLAVQCLARIESRVDELPVARPRKVLPERQLGVLLIRWGDRILLERRPPAGIWGGLWSLPELRETDSAEDALQRLIGHREPCRASTPIRHVFTHFRLDIRPWECTVKRCGSQVAEPGGHEWVPLAELEDYGLPTPIRALILR